MLYAIASAKRFTPKEDLKEHYALLDSLHDIVADAPPPTTSEVGPWLVRDESAVGQGQEYG